MPQMPGLSPCTMSRDGSAPVDEPARRLLARLEQAALPRGRVLTTSFQFTVSHTASRLSSPAG